MSGAQTGLPISPFQDALVATALDPQTHVGYHHLMTIRWGCRVKPGLSPRAVRRAFDVLVARHDSLRLRFVPQASAWRAEILPKHPTGLHVEDISTLSEDAQDAVIKEQADQPKHALSPTLFDMHLYLCGTSGSVILIKAHHSIMDGFGLIVLIEEMLKAFLNIPIGRKSPSHRQFVTYLESETKRNESRNREFWNERLFPIPIGFNRPCLDAPVPLLSSRYMVPAVVLENVLTPVQSAALGRLAKVTGVTDFTLLYAAFSRSLCRKISREEILIYSSLPRNSAFLGDFVGCCIQDVAIRFSENKGNIFELSKKISAELQGAVDHTPVDDFFRLNSKFNMDIKSNYAHSSRFRVHRHAPTGRLANSPFRKIFDRGAKGKLSMGALSIEQLHWPGSGLTLHEAFLSVFSSEAGTNATIVGRSDVFEVSDLEEIAADMVTHLRV